MRRVCRLYVPELADLALRSVPYPVHTCVMFVAFTYPDVADLTLRNVPYPIHTCYMMVGIIPPTGKPAVDMRLFISWKRYSSTCAVGVDGILDIYNTKGNVNEDTFCNFLERLVPKLMPFNGRNPRSIVKVDNVTFHHCSHVLATIESAGVFSSTVFTRSESS